MEFAITNFYKNDFSLKVLCLSLFHENCTLLLILISPLKTGERKGRGKRERMRGDGETETERERGG